ncbi:hypothetical protein EVAR_63446_1 [Eumeta japonica]|uniref:Uncharacterized protein n=1 Tax=Eumeta variegata TaxID=151549 RepID=A0A4C1YQN3_EUMVA|nr:hypothetical protein EVAR_63446_1 [Eumeta japonica]
MSQNFTSTEVLFFEFYDDKRTKVKYSARIPTTGDHQQAVASVSDVATTLVIASQALDPPLGQHGGSNAQTAYYEISRRWIVGGFIPPRVPEKKGLDRRTDGRTDGQQSDPIRVPFFPFEILFMHPASRPLFYYCQRISNFESSTAQGDLELLTTITADAVTISVADGLMRSPTHGTNDSISLIQKSPID